MILYSEAGENQDRLGTPCCCQSVIRDVLKGIGQCAQKIEGTVFKGSLAGPPLRAITGADSLRWGLRESRNPEGSLTLNTGLFRGRCLSSPPKNPSKHPTAPVLQSQHLDGWSITEREREPVESMASVLSCAWLQLQQRLWALELQGNGFVLSFLRAHAPEQ